MKLAWFTEEGKEMPPPPKQDSPMTAAKVALQRSELHEAARRGDAAQIKTLVEVRSLCTQLYRFGCDLHSRAGRS